MNPTLILMIGGGLTLILLVVGGVVALADRRSVIDERIERYGSGTTAAVATAPAGGGARTSFLGDQLDQVLSRRGFAPGIKAQLARADLKLNVGEYLALVVICAIGTGAVFTVLNGSMFIGILAGIGGAFLPRFYVRARMRGRLRRFDDQLSDMINLAVNGLRAGYSIMQALESVGREMPAPISTEFRRVVQEMQLGVSMEGALDNLLRRIPSEDLDLMVTAVNIQREVGGNLADVLETISFTIRERVRIKGEIRVLTSQQSFSGYLLSGLPFALAGVLFLVNRPYMLTFVAPESRVLGIPMLVAAALLIAAGYFVMRKIVDIDV